MAYDPDLDPILTDLTARLPGASERRDDAVWKRIVLGDGRAPETLPGFSR